MPPEMFADNPHLPWDMVLIRLGGAVLLCSLIGLEREIKNFATGLRTNMLIGFGSAAFALVTQHMLAVYGQTGDGVRMDPIRLIEAATAGAAFLAAGTIVLSRGRVRGLTTGALLWVSAAVGLSSGLGLWVLAVPITGFALVITVGVTWFIPKNDGAGTGCWKADDAGQ